MYLVIFDWFLSHSYVHQLSWGQGPAPIGGAQVCPLAGTKRFGSAGGAGCDTTQGRSGHQNSLQSADGARFEPDGHQDRVAREEQDHAAGC